jgi:hypothetical protein
MTDYIVKFYRKQGSQKYTSHVVLTSEQYKTLLEISNIRHGNTFDMWEYVYIGTTDIITNTTFPEYNYHKNKVNQKTGASGLLSVLDFIIFNEY